MTRASTHPAEPRPARFANPVVRCLAATRPAFLTVTLVGCLIGIASAHALMQDWKKEHDANV